MVLLTLDGYSTLRQTQLCGRSSSSQNQKLENTLYFRKTPAGDLCFVLICQVDNYVYAGETKQIKGIREVFAVRVRRR